jgi:chromosomal replication initiation ATPase DnaA
MNIFWVSGKSGYGKTEFVNSIIQRFERKNKITTKLSGKDFIDFLVKNIKAKNSSEIVCHFQNYDLVVLDNIDYGLLNKPATQTEIKNVIRKITGNNKTKVILVSEKRARKLKRLKFNSEECLYRHIKAPNLDFKRDLIKSWLKRDVLVISKISIEGIANKSKNLFQLKGLFSKIKLSADGKS